MRYLFAILTIVFSISAQADDRLKNAIDNALATYQMLENQALTEYFIDISNGVKEQKARRRYFNRELEIRAQYYDVCDTACLRHTGNKCRWN